jgi:hypothetical protein
MTMKSAKVTAPSVHHFLFFEDRILGATLLPAPQVGNNLRARSSHRLTVPRASAKPIATPRLPSPSSPSQRRSSDPAFQAITAGAADPFERLRHSEKMAV